MSSFSEIRSTELGQTNPDGTHIPDVALEHLRLLYVGGIKVGFQKQLNGELAREDPLHVLNDVGTEVGNAIYESEREYGDSDDIVKIYNASDLVRGAIRSRMLRSISRMKRFQRNSDPFNHYVSWWHTSLEDISSPFTPDDFTPVNPPEYLFPTLWKAYKHIKKRVSLEAQPGIVD